MEEQDIKIDFSYTDEFGQESRLIKSFTPDVLEVTNSFNLLLGEFIKFMKAAGFSEESANKIIYIDEE